MFCVHDMNEKKCENLKSSIEIIYSKNYNEVKLNGNMIENGWINRKLGDNLRKKIGLIVLDCWFYFLFN